MSWGRLLDPLLLASALSLGVYLAATAELPTQAELHARADNVLPAFVPESISAIRWSRPHDFSLVRDLEAENTMRYFVGEPTGPRADEEEVRAVLRLLDLASFRRTLGSGAHVDSQELGFSTPRVELSIIAGPRSYRIVAGAKAPSPADSVYLKVEGTNIEPRVGVVDETLVSQLEKSEQEFLGGLVFPLARSETLELSLDHGNGKIRLVPDEHAFFLSADGQSRTLADRQLVDLIFFQLARTKIETYLDAPPPSPMLVTVEQRGPDGTTYRAALGAPCPGDPLSVVAHRTHPSETLGCVSRSVLAAYLSREDELRSITPTELNPDEIDHAIVEYEDRRLDLLRNERGYELLEGDRTPVPREAGDDFLKALSQTHHTLLEGPPNEARPVGDVVLKGQLRNTIKSEEKGRTDHTYEARLIIFAEGDQLFLQRLADDAWLGVSKDDVWPFLAYQGWARERKLFSFEPPQIRRLVVTLPSGASWTVERSEERFVLAGPPEEPADPALSRELFAQVAGLEALRFMTPPQPRPEEPLLHLKLEIDSPDAPTSRDIWVGGRVRGGFRAWSDGFTFVLPYNIRSILEKPLVDRRPLKLDLDEQNRVLIETEGRSFLFVREGGLLRARDGEATDEMIEPLSLALSSLRVVSAAGDHPAGRSIRRGPPVISISAVSRGPSGATSEIRIGQPTVWQGLSCRTVWIEGDDETFFVEQASLEELSEIL